MEETPEPMTPKEIMEALERMVKEKLKIEETALRIHERLDLLLFPVK